MIPGTEVPIDEGITAPFRCIAIVDGERVAVVAKRIINAGIERECVCAVLFRAWGISAPEPLLLRRADGTVLFASLDEGYPNLKKALAISRDLPEEKLNRLTWLASKIICSWEDAPRVLAGDEIVENGDRNLGNFLWGGGNEHMYIDHERALGGAPFDENLMVRYAVAAEQKDAMCNGATTFANMGIAANLSGLEQHAGLDFGWALAQVQTHIVGLAQRIIERFPWPDDLLSQ